MMAPVSETDGDPLPDRVLTPRDVGAATVIAIVMGALFVAFGGKPLAVTFVPGLVAAWGVVVWHHRARCPLPGGSSLYPIYFGTLAWQFLHFLGEYATGFRVGFPLIYGHATFGDTVFVGVNMLSYAVFAVAFILAFRFNLRFFVLPCYFFILYGVIGNAIAHPLWSILAEGYFPGLFSSVVYWAIGPFLLARFMGSGKAAALVMGVFAVILVPLLTLARDAPMAPGCRHFHALICYRA